MRLGYDEAGAVLSEKEMKKLSKSPLYKGFKTMYKVDPDMAKDNPAYGEKFNTFEQLYKKGFQEGGDVEPVAKKTMPLLDMDGKEIWVEWKELTMCQLDYLRMNLYLQLML